MIGVGSNLTIGLGAKRFNSLLLAVLPLTAAISLFLIADIDSPRGGVVEVRAPELEPAGGVVGDTLIFGARPTANPVRRSSAVPYAPWTSAQRWRERRSAGAASPAGKRPMRRSTRSAGRGPSVRPPCAGKRGHALTSALASRCKTRPCRSLSGSDESRGQTSSDVRQAPAGRPNSPAPSRRSAGDRRGGP